MVLFAFIGGLYLLVSLVAIPLVLYDWWQRSQISLDGLLTALMFLFLGTVLLLAARWCWRKQWIHLAILIATLATFIAVANYLARYIGPQSSF